eukprot:Skav216512  [mRNA]  locus=scaffold1123:743010:753161:- [translate_table: standard]
MQQRGQDEAMHSVLAKGMRANRFVSASAPVGELAVVLLHMVLRALHLRLLYHRAAVAIQQRYRYIKLRGQKQSAIAPAMRIQRFWRGLRAALGIMRKDDAAWKILRNYKAMQNWTCILDPTGRKLTKDLRKSIEDLVARKSQMSETAWGALIASQSAKARQKLAQHRKRNLDGILMRGLGPRSAEARNMDKQRRLRMKGALQPERETVFEPFIFALARLDIQEPRYGAKRSPVMEQVIKAKKELIRSGPLLEDHRRAMSIRNSGIVRIKNEVVTRRLAKKARHTTAHRLEPEEAPSGVGPTWLKHSAEWAVIAL